MLNQLRKKSMQHKFLALPRVLLNKITEDLSTKDLFQFIQVDKKTYQLFKSGISNSIKRSLVNRFLNHVVQGEHDAVATMLKLKPDLAWLRGQVTDLSGRIFENVSGFEYALWALDKHMWTTMLVCLPKNNKKMSIKLNRQYQDIQESKITYRLNNTFCTEQHFNFNGTIIEALNHYSDPIENCDNSEFIRRLGYAQRLLPIHVVFEYCSNERWSKFSPTFIQSPKNRLKNFWNEEIGAWDSWFAADSKLGSHFVICKDASCAKSFGDNFFSVRTKLIWIQNLEMLERLYQLRTDDFISLKDTVPLNLSKSTYR